MENTQTPRELVNLAFKAVAVGMSVAAIVLGAVGTATPSTLITLLAIGLFCLAIPALQTQIKRNDESHGDASQ